MGKPPLTISTDQDLWMTEAIRVELPSIKLSFCIWHITTKFSGWFSSVLRSKCFEWLEQFEHEWPIAIPKYKLNNNSYIIGLYNVRTFGIPTFLLDYFFETIRHTDTCDSMLEKHKFHVSKIISPLKNKFKRF
ncbi:hypothetical protein MKX01_003233 [Papaver californicum]|nr:hypothetical protein MKX01_003233 [Papaver californicum]